MGSCDLLEYMKLSTEANWKTKGSKVQKQTTVKQFPWLKREAVGSPFLYYSFLLSLLEKVLH